MSRNPFDPEAKHTPIAQAPRCSWEKWPDVAPLFVPLVAFKEITLEAKSLVLFVSDLQSNISASFGVPESVLRGNSSPATVGS